MKESFRQSMTWLHTWAGLLVGWVLFFVFLTGTFGYINAEVDRWMRPEQPILSAPRPIADLLRLAERRLRLQVSDAEFWQISLPEGRGSPDLYIGWRPRPVTGEKSSKFTREVLDNQTGSPIHRKVRETGGGGTLYAMHYALHYMPSRWAYYIVGICTMFMLVAILTGIVAHKKIFKDFFTFRPAKGQRSWLDGHNLLAVTALPFHVMITWSGLVFFLFTYMPIAVDALYPGDEARNQFFTQIYGFDRPDRSVDHPAASLAPLGSMLAQTEKIWGADTTASIVVDNPGRDNARVTFRPQSTIIGEREPLRFDGVTGIMRESAGARPVVSRFNNILLSLHEGRFAGPVLRLLYVVAGLAGAALIGTGLLLWSTKRKARLRQTMRPHFGIAVVDVLNLGTIIGLPIGVAAYFWANRVLPVEMTGRAAWEVHAMFITWSVTFLYTAVRPLDRAWIELCCLASAAYALLPLLNVVTTERHLGVTIPAGDWSLASIDLGMLVAGLFFAFLARNIQRKQIGDRAQRSKRAASRSELTAEAAE